MNLINLLLPHLIFIIIFFVAFLFVLFSSSQQLDILRNKLILRILIFALVIELIASISIFLEVKPALATQSAFYQFSFGYKDDYSQDWINSSPTEKEKSCIENYIKNPSNRNEECKYYEDKYIRQEQVFGLTGDGIAYLMCNNDVSLKVTPRDCKGISSYKFPSKLLEEEIFPVTMDIDVNFNSDKEIEIEFIQKSSCIEMNNDGQIDKRPKNKFSITATRKGNSNEFTGQLKHPEREIIIADFKLCTSHEC